MGLERYRERERTFDVGADWVVPDLSTLVVDGGRVTAATHELQATYFDTESSTLRHLGISLRHRRGGPDEGWHLKVPAGDARTEVHSAAAAGAIPAALSRRVAGVVAGQRLSPVATIRTTRRSSQVLDGSGLVVVEVADDQVAGTRAADGATTVEWREVEVELGPAGDEDDLGAVGRLFDAAGARPAAVQRKIEHILGESPHHGLRGIAGLLADYVTEQCRTVLVGDVVLRDDPASESVHRIRIAIRRLRSTVRLFARAFAVPETALADLDDDLKWLAELLSPIRDGDILRRRLDDELRQLTPADVIGPVRSEITRALGAERAAALGRWREAGTGEQYQRVMATLSTWSVMPPIHAKPPVKPAKVLGKARRTVERRLGTAQDPDALHRARKAAKRLRYAADVLDSSRTAGGVKEAGRTAQRAKQLQTALGEYQDLVVAGAFLRRLGAKAGSPDVRNGFTYGVLVSRVEQQAERIRRHL